MTVNVTLEVHRTDHRETRRTEHDLGPLADGHVRLRVDRLAVTANTVTYAVMGDALGYWDFYPTGDPEWGLVPAMGWADVVESAHPGAAVGERFYGWFPMATQVDVLVSPVAGGLRDVGAHRAAHAGVYRTFSRTTDDPLYPALAPDDAALGDAEDRHALLRGLFLTGFLADGFLDAEAYFGAEQVVVLSASSKTAIAFAHQAHQRRIDVVGVTSAAHLDVVRGLGCYDDVVAYDDIATLPVVPSVSVDMAGNGAALEAVHAHLGERLAYSMTIGKSHHDSPPVALSAGPTPEFFFAPTAAGRLIDTWGADEFARRSAASTHEFVTASTEWLTVERRRGADASASTWREVYDGSVPPDVGRVISLHE